MRNTTTDDAWEVVRCYGFGCDDYINKPVAYDQFSARDKLSLWLNHYHDSGKRVAVDGSV